MRRLNLSQQNRNFYPANCSINEGVGDLVYIYDEMEDGKLNVRKVDPTDFNKMPAIGLIIKKFSNTECVVQTSGIVRNLFGSLTKGRNYFCGSNGQPKISFISPGFVQVIAIAVGNEELLLNIDLQMTRIG